MADGVSDNLFIGDLPADITDDYVNTIFSPYGNVLSCKAIPPKTPGGKGAALVRFQTIEEAQWVQENLNGNLAEGLDTPIVVTYARSGNPGAAAKGKGKGGFGVDIRSSPYGGAGKGGKPGAMPGFAFGGGGPFDFRSVMKGLVKGGVIPGGGNRPDEQCIYIKGLPPDTSDFTLYELFAPFGAIAPFGVKAMLKEDGTCTSVGFVDFQDSMSAAAAVEALNGTPLPDGSVLTANLKRSSKKGGKGDKGGKGWAKGGDAQGWGKGGGEDQGWGKGGGEDQGAEG